MTIGVEEGCGDGWPLGGGGGFEGMGFASELGVVREPQYMSQQVALPTNLAVGLGCQLQGYPANEYGCEGRCDLAHSQSSFVEPPWISQFRVAMMNGAAVDGLELEQAVWQPVQVEVWRCDHKTFLQPDASSGPVQGLPPALGVYRGLDHMGGRIWCVWTSASVGELVVPGVMTSRSKPLTFDLILPMKL